MSERKAHPFDGLRAILIGLVVAGHLELIGSLAGGQSRAIAFFALSGFLVTTVLLKRHEQHGAIGLKNFYVMRVARFAPSLVIATLLAVVASMAFTYQWWAADSVPIDMMVGAIPAFWSQTVNLALQDETQSVPYEFVPGWSLGLEWQFYLIWPVAIVLLLSVFGTRARVVLGSLAVTGAIGSFLWSVWLTIDAGGESARVAYGSDTRSGSIMLGCAAAALIGREGVRLWCERNAVRIVVASLAVMAFLFFQIVIDTGPQMTTWGQVALAFVVSATACAMWVRPDPFKVLVMVPVAWLGQRSLAIFLVHVPVMQLLGGRGDLLRSALVIALTIVIAWSTRRWLERPLLALTRPQFAEIHSGIGPTNPALPLAGVVGAK